MDSVLLELFAKWSVPGIVLGFVAAKVKRLPAISCVAAGAALGWLSPLIFLVSAISRSDARCSSCNTIVGRASECPKCGLATKHPDRFSSRPPAAGSECRWCKQLMIPGAVVCTHCAHPVAPDHVELIECGLCYGRVRADSQICMHCGRERRPVFPTLSSAGTPAP
jgi:hypothetical protein